MKTLIRNPIVSLLPIMLCAASLRAAEVPIVIRPDAPAGVRLAAEDLANDLGQLYPQDRFTLTGSLPADGKAIVLGQASSDRVRAYLENDAPTVPESFVVRTRGIGGLELGIIAGADARGTACGVYQLLGRLGCGFYLSGDTMAAPRTGAFDFAGWNLDDAPLVRDRLVFDWHNFLSGCSTWNPEDWNSWTDQSLKQGYNGIMVHAYGNNPMVSFSFNGKTKPVGYLSTTAKGRDWSTMHVNDVRRLIGGEVFDAPVFGADAAQVPDEQRADAARNLMQGVFSHAQQRGMEVFFANDVDTGSANPQDLILTLPENARFAIQTKAGGMTGVAGHGDARFWLANPETPEGYGYYKAQVEALMTAYPQITTLVAWFRRGGTPWMEMKVAEMPPAWQEEWRVEIARTPEAAKLWHAPQIFALGKIVRTFDRALKELGHDRVKLAAGTWDFDFLAPCDRFFPAHVKLIGLDYSVLHDHSQLGDAVSRRVISEVAGHRPVVPVIWAQHDDGNYIGRPYTPFTDFSTRLANAKACGFGIIHWTTRPLDLFFKSHAEQVWSTTKDRPLRRTCDDMAERSFGASARAPMGAYLERWVTDAPKFARETSDFLIDRPLTNVAQVVTGCDDRLKLIGAVDANLLTPEQRDRLDYFKGLEEFIAAFFKTQTQFQNVRAAVKKGDLAAARAEMEGCQPEQVIARFAKFSSLGGITRGEQGLVVSLNTRWLPHYVRLRQELGLEPVRYAFAPTSHDPLAQSAGRFTFHFDRQHALWETHGGKETGASAFVVPAEVEIERDAAMPAAYQEICRTGVESPEPIRFTLQPIMAHDSRNRSKPVPMPAGDYRLRLLMADPASTAAGQRVFDVMLTAGSAFAVANRTDRVDVFKRAGGANRLLELDYPVKLAAPGPVTVELAPVIGKALVCGAVLEPVRQ